MSRTSRRRAPLLLVGLLLGIPWLAPCEAQQRRVSGVVVDDLGRPAADVTVRTRKSVAGRMQMDWTDEAGRFVIVAEPGAAEEFQLDVRAMELEYERLEDERVFRWGTEGIRLVVQRTFGVELRVSEKGTGRPVEDFGVRCWTTGPKYDDDELRLQGPHPGGRVIVDQVLLGENLLKVVPGDEGLAVNEDFRFDLTRAGRDEPIHIELERLVPFLVQVLDADGEPVAFCPVEVIRGRRDEVELDDYVEDPRDTGGRYSEPPHELLSSALTDERGIAEVRGLLSCSRQVVDVHGEGFQRRIVRHPRIEGEGSLLRVEVERSAAVRGQLGGDSVELLRGRYQATVQAWCLTQSGQRLAGSSPVQEGGLFALEALPSGEYDLYLCVVVQFESRSGAAGFSAPCLGPPLARLQLSSGELHELRVDITSRLPGDLQGRLLLPPELRSAAGVRVHGIGVQGETWTLGDFVPDATGAFVAPHLLPGDYRLSVILDDAQSSRQGILEAEGTFRVEPGGRVMQRFEFPPRQRLRVQLRNRNGRVLGNTPCMIEAGRDCIGLTTDADGWIELDPAPTRPFQVRCEFEVSAPIQTPPGQAEAELQVVVPTSGG